MSLSRYDLAYYPLLGLLTPLAWIRPKLAQKLSRARKSRNGAVPERLQTGPCVLIHAVSVGEVNATRRLVERLLQARNGLTVIVSVTTETGLARAKTLFAAETDRVMVVPYPLDLSSMVNRFLDALRPDVAVLMELEVWPNFVAECGRRGVPVLLVNGRITERSYRNFRRVRPLIAPMYRGLSRVAAQEDLYAERFRRLGVPADRVEVTGTMKFDSAHVGERVEGDAELAKALELSPRALGGEEPVLVCGSTGPVEEAVLAQAWLALRERFPTLRLVLVPRKPERFDEVASILTDEVRVDVVRRSRPGEILRARRVGSDGEQGRGGEAGPGRSPVILGDTMGELRKFYSLADVVVVGRTLVDLGEKQHGSDMIEPAAQGKPVVVGPYTGNFAEPMRALRSAGAIAEVPDPEVVFDSMSIGPLVEVLGRWLDDPAAARAVGNRAREVVVQQQGATERHVEHILDALDATGRPAQS